jgi:hypothetical protein
MGIFCCAARLNALQALRPAAGLQLAGDDDPLFAADNPAVISAVPALLPLLIIGS